MTMDMNKELPCVENSHAPLDVHFVLDETGSMASFGTEPMESVNTFIRVQRDAGIPIEISLTTFNLYIHPVFTLPMNDPDCRLTTYTPSNFTAAYDALRYVILTATKPLAVVFVTDGQDNSSITTREEIKFLIEKATTCGWKFQFIGCTQESMVESRHMGMYTSQDINAPPASLPQLIRNVSHEISQLNRDRTS